MANQGPGDEALRIHVARFEQSQSSNVVKPADTLPSVPMSSQHSCPIPYPYQEYNPPQARRRVQTHRSCGSIAPETISTNAAATDIERRQTDPIQRPDPRHHEASP
jgi:hypothetical protein